MSAVTTNTGLPLAPTSRKAQWAVLEQATPVSGIPPLAGAGCQVSPPSRVTSTDLGLAA